MFGWFDRNRTPADGNEWKCQFLDLAGTDFYAVVSPWRSVRPVLHWVAVERKWLGSQLSSIRAWSICFA